MLAEMQHSDLSILLVSYLHPFCMASYSTLFSHLNLFSCQFSSVLLSAELFGLSRCCGESVFVAAEVLRGLMRAQFRGVSVRPWKINAASANERPCGSFNKCSAFYIVMGLDGFLNARCSTIRYK